MAYIKIEPIKKDLLQRAAYAMKPQKTLWQGKPLVSGIRVDLTSPGYAVRSMEDEKGIWNNPDGPNSRLAYHAYQSFAPGETDPETAHKIGLQFAEKAWGDHFQVLVCTHVDKGHIHTHFIINSVSDQDGKRYHEDGREFRRLRKLSDRLCREYGLSIIDNPALQAAGARGNPDPEARPQEKRRAAVRQQIYRDMDRALESAVDMDSFWQALQQLGYRVKLDREHPAIAPPGKGYFRLYKFAPGYREEDIRRRLEERAAASRQETMNLGLPSLGGKLYFFKGQRITLRRMRPFRLRYTHYLLRRRHWLGLRHIYLQTCVILRRVEKNTYPRAPRMDLRQEQRKLRQYSEEALFLCRNQIDGQEQLLERTMEIEGKLQDLNRRRARIRRERRKDIPQAERDALTAQLEQLGAEAKPLYRERALCRDILKNSGVPEQIVREERNWAVREQYRDYGLSQDYEPTQARGPGRRQNTEMEER